MQVFYQSNNNLFFKLVIFQLFLNVCSQGNCQALAQVGQDSGGVTIPGSVQKMCGCGTQGRGWCGEHGGGGLEVGLDDLKGLFQL